MIKKQIVFFIFVSLFICGFNWNNTSITTWNNVTLSEYNNRNVSSTQATDYINDPNAVGIYYFENNGNDETANGNTLTNNNSCTFETASPDPKQGTYSTFLQRSSDQSWSSTSTDFDVTGPFSFGGWVYPEATSSETMRVGSKHGGSGSYGWALIRQDDPFLIEFGISSDGTAWDTTTAASASLPVNTWTHIVCVYDGSYKRIYVNGSEISDGNFPASYSSGVNDTSANFIIGDQDYSTHRYWNGNLDEMFFFSRALSASEISDIYNNGLE